MPKPKKTRPRPEDHKAKVLFSNFEVGLSRAVLDSNPRHSRALEMLGQALTRVGRHNEALEPTCAWPTSGRRIRSPSITSPAATRTSTTSMPLSTRFRRAFDLGYRDYRHLLRDPDLENVRRDRRFKSLLDKKWGKRQP
jgi:hypothetical protein